VVDENDNSSNSSTSDADESEVEDIEHPKENGVFHTKNNFDIVILYNRLLGQSAGNPTSDVASSPIVTWKRDDVLIKILSKYFIKTIPWKVHL